MRSTIFLNFYKITFFVVFLLMGFTGFAQKIKVNIVGGVEISGGSTTTITAGTSLNFRITNTEPNNCNDLEIQNITITNTPAFGVTGSTGNVKPASCSEWWWIFLGIKSSLDFSVKNNSPTCTVTQTEVSIKVRGQSDFKFTLQVNSSPKISVLGGSPLADIKNGLLASETTATNGTFFGTAEAGASRIRNYVIANTGSCPLIITSASISAADFTLPSSFKATVLPGKTVILPVTFKGPLTGTGSRTGEVTISNNDTEFTFAVKAEVFNENIPAPGGVTSAFKLWLKATRGITQDGNKVSNWADLGTNPKNAIQPDNINQPSYLDDAASNINFNPVIKFENSGSVEQFLYNDETPESGFYSADIFIVMVPDNSINYLSSKNTIFGGVQSGLDGDITGVGFGDYSSAFTNEVLSYNQNIPSPESGFNGAAEISKTKTYSGVGIINVTNNSAATPTAQQILYNSNPLTTSPVSNSFANINGSKYWIGKNFNQRANLNGRVAEIFTFGTKLDATSRNKVESYLALKYGITLGASNKATKDYVNSFSSNNVVWNTVTNTGFNYDIAGIGKDVDSDLNQKQSKSVNSSDEVTIGLGGIFATNSNNPNQFNNNGDFLVWGNNGLPFSGSMTRTVTLGAGIATSLTHINRKWKIVESTQAPSNVGNVYVSIPLNAFASFPKAPTEEYALIVSSGADFTATDIIDVIPLRRDGTNGAGPNLQTWYDFDGTKFFTFGIVTKLTEKHAVTIGSNNYLLGDRDLQLNVNDFTISAWVKADKARTSTRTIMSKGEKLQMRLNSSQEVEIVIDEPIETPKFTSTMKLNDDKWHQITFVYNSGTVFLYIDGVLDKSAQNVVAPSPNFNNFCIGALYVDKITGVQNPFLGQIDEVYIWDKGLTESQVRYLMNQEIEKNGVNVAGKVIPFATSSNETKTILWEKLKVYYDFNDFYGSTIEGKANTEGSTTDRFFLRINYLNKTSKSVLVDQTAPLPYESANSRAWDDPTTWINNVDQVLPNSQSLDGSTVVRWNIAKIGHDITSGDRNIALLGLIQTAGKLTIAAAGVQDETNLGRGLAISHYLELDGVIDLVGDSQLLQSEGSILDADSGGFIERDQQGTANSFNYNYWSSSVGPIGGDVTKRGIGIAANNANYTISGVLKDGTDTNDHENITFGSSAYAADNPPTSPITISSRWLYTFNGPQNAYDAWIKIHQNTSLSTGEGFTMKGSSGSVPLATSQNYVFKGLPNNGDFTMSLNKIGGNDVERLIGNPYPSAMDATQFILDNLSVSEGGNNTKNIFNGALYFWDHFGKKDTHVLGKYVGGYATRNLTGGVAAISNDARISDDLPNTLAKEPGQFIPVNQAFFVSTQFKSGIPNNNNGTIAPTVDGGHIVFKNSQRVYEIENGLTSQFFKQSSNKNTGNLTKTGKPTIRLMYDSPLGYQRQIVLGTNINATEGFDMGYDAVMVDVNEEDMYWTLNNTEFVIQGVGAIDTDQEFSLGLIVKKAGVVSIKVDALENMDANTALFIKDNLTNEAHKITYNSFDIFLHPGNYNDRFTLVFKDSGSLSADDINANVNNILVYYDADVSELKLVNKQSVFVSNINLYTILGQNIDVFKINSSKSESIPLTIATGVYIVKLNTENGTVNKKIIID